MSDSQSVRLPHLSTPVKEPAATLVNANVVLQKVLHNLSSENRNHLILRCEDLPFVQGVEADIEKVFSVLLQLILRKKEDVAKVFLHISAVEAEAKSNNGQLVKQAVIQFNTNLNPCSNWMEMNEGHLQTITAIVQKYSGCLTINSVTAGGCILSVSLPGKTL
jgi:hypothetical protein